MIDYTLKFADEAQANEVLFDGETPRYPAIDVIGTIYRATGNVTTDENGIEHPDMEPTPGWHVNVRTEMEAVELDAYRVFPVTPARVWA